MEYPEDVSPTKHLEFKRWRYATYDFTLAIFWSPYLVKVREEDIGNPPHAGQFNLYLDEFDKEWTGKVAEFSHVIISAGHWFTRPMIYYENRRRVGCTFENPGNVTRLSTSYGYRKAFRTAFRALNRMKSYKGITYLRTFSPSHFEGGPWNKGGHCQRTRPFKRNETSWEGTDLDFYQRQVEEFRKAKEEGRKKGLKYRLLDTTRPMLLRPDGHPSTYGHWPHEMLTLYNDCVHWCLPGPIDTWNDFLLEIMKTDI